MVTDNYGNVPLNLRHHEHVEVLAPASQHVWVDKGIASLLVTLWDRGIETLYSCAGDENMRGYIYFTSSEDFQKFSQVMAGSSAKYSLDKKSPIVRFDQSALRVMTRYLD